MNLKNTEMLTILTAVFSAFTLFSVLFVASQLHTIKVPPQVVEKVVVVTPAPTATPAAMLKPATVVKPTVKAVVK